VVDDGFDFVMEMNFLELAALTECVHRDGAEAGRDCDGLQTAAFRECIRIKTSERWWEGNGGESGARRESKAADGRDTVMEMNLRKIVAPFKRACRDRGEAWRESYGL